MSTGRTKRSELPRESRNAVIHGVLTETVVIRHCVSPVRRRRLGGYSAYLCDSWARCSELCLKKKKIIIINEPAQKTERKIMEKEGERASLQMCSLLYMDNMD